MNESNTDKLLVLMLQHKVGYIIGNIKAPESDDIDKLVIKFDVNADSYEANILNGEEVIYDMDDMFEMYMVLNNCEIFDYGYSESISA